MRTAVVVLAGFLLSAFGVVAGYSPYLSVFDSQLWKWALRDLPVISAASANLVSACLALFAGFWASRGDKEVYKSALLGYSFFLPFVVVLWFLPGEQSKPEWASLNFGITIGCFIFVQFSVCRLLRETVWLRGGRGAA